jgi:metal-responsive CopG/Arc/MetJ family transcriptional regulator
MPAAKVAISLEPELLARLDAEAAAAGQSRSALVRECLRSALDAREEERTVRAARAIYGEIEAQPESVALHEAFWSVARELVPPFTTPVGHDQPRETPR